ncbi:unnamed protein product [Blepharisma stoltei]|uniref:Uncharacterized protein n=1 Tax=Blepharisma stoltei TaxID=1481888 RepID=A0AAU9JGG6_9CILI|nr:unnamed protein product [Blepharisma stoltei]
MYEPKLVNHYHEFNLDDLPETTSKHWNVNISTKALNQRKLIYFNGKSILENSNKLTTSKDPPALASCKTRIVINNKNTERLIKKSLAKKKSRSNNNSITDSSNLVSIKEPPSLQLESSLDKKLHEGILKGRTLGFPNKLDLQLDFSYVPKMVHSYAIPNGLSALKLQVKPEKTGVDLYEPKISQFMNRFEKKPNQIVSMPIIRTGINGWKLSSTTPLKKNN